jgi:hypothetical protein
MQREIQSTQGEVKELRNDFKTMNWKLIGGLIAVLGHILGTGIYVLLHR